MLYLAVGSRDNKIHLYKIITDNYYLISVNTFSFEDQDVNSVAFDPNGKFLAGIGNTQRFRVYSTSYPYQMVFNGTYWLEDNKDGYAVSFNPRGNILIAAGSQHTTSEESSIQKRKIGLFGYFKGYEVVE